MKTLEITPLTGVNEHILALLYLADPSEAAVSDYLKRGCCYVAALGDQPVGEYVLLPTRPFTVELVNVAVAEKHHGKGYGKALVLHAIETAKAQGYRIIEVGTGDAGLNQLALYQKCGFSMTGIDIDFFRKHYSEPIFENGIECRHMVRLSLALSTVKTA